MSLLNFIFKVYNENITGNRELILQDTTTTIVRHRKYVSIGLIIGLGLYSCWPCYDFLFNGNLTLVSPMLIPFVDPTILVGYLTLTAVNIFAAAWAMTGTYAFSCLFLLYVGVYDGLVSLIEDDFNMFDSMWERKDAFIISKRKDAFRNIMMELMDLARYDCSRFFE